ncbi:MAG: inosose dehydratase [Arcticibacterium sp.]|jgi:inosose dehydratase
MERRDFLAAVPAIGLMSSFKSKEKLPISCSAYDWTTFYRRNGKEWGDNIPNDIAEYAKSGISALEPNITSVALAIELIPQLKKQGISMPSIYVNSLLHEKEKVEEGIKTILAIADRVKPYGTSIIVTNPSPINWGGDELKTDSQLAVQAAALNKLGAALRKKGIKLAYHTHDMEMKAGAREFHHMLQNTDDENMGFCFDLHWVYQGSMDSALAVYDTLKIYGHRIVELHLRQSKDGVWSEALDIGLDIDYQKVAKELLKINVTPHLVIEQCISEETPKTMTAVEAHQRDLVWVKKVFKEFL